MFKATFKNPRKLIRSEFLIDFWGEGRVLLIFYISSPLLINLN